MNGLEHIANAFRQARQEGRAAFCPYLAIGHPTLPDSVDIIEAAARSGADLMELGVPFSDPLADGPTIQAATQKALANGATVARCIEAVATLRKRGARIPFVLMGYYNPILRYGEERYCRDAAQAGADGLIVPDLPPEEGERLSRCCRQYGLALVYLLAPTSTAERIRLVVSKSSGFIYCVSVTGITGARDRLPPDLTDFLARVRAARDERPDGVRLPFVVGFGISTPQQVATVGRLADGVVVGSALVKLADGPEPLQKVTQAIRELGSGLRQPV